LAIQTKKDANADTVNVAGVPSWKAAGLMNGYQFVLNSHQLEMHLAQTRIGNDAK
jgi:hypothetical protein